MGLTRLLLAGMRRVRVARVWVQEEAVHIDVCTTGRYARCPVCGRHSKRLHSRYWRLLADSPCGERPVRLRVQVRRFRCRVPWCPRRIFAERVPDLAPSRARHTARLTQHLLRTGILLGGEAGARYLATQGVRISPRTVLRRVRGHPLPPAAPVRVLGVDDWAWRRGRSYGTILINLETHTVIDLLPDRTAPTLATWLVAHPEIEIISRDRAGAYAEGARLGAPQARQVADRFHLLRNVTEAFHRYLTRKQAVLRQAARPPTAPTPATPPIRPAAARPQPAAAGTRAQREAAAARGRRLACYTTVQAQAAAGRSQTVIARDLGMSRRTVRSFLQAPTFPERRPYAPRGSQVQPYHAYLLARWQQGCQCAAQLYRELRARGYRGSVSAVGRYLQAAHMGTLPRATPGGAVLSATPRQTTWLLLGPDDALTAPEQGYRDRLYRLCPEIALVQALVREFRTLVRAQDVPGWYRWLTGLALSTVPELGRVARGMWMDRQAIEAALTLPWSQGQVEGQVNRLKAIKRAGYGRSSFDLLRRRVLCAT